MTIFLLELPELGGNSKRDGVSAMIVEADDVAKSRLLASAQDEGDNDWVGSTATTIAAGIASDYAGFVYNVRVSNSATSDGQSDFIDVSYTGVASDTIDLVGAGLEAALNGFLRNAMKAAIADDGGVFTDETTAANEATADDMNFLPATPASGDAFYYGASEPFTVLTLNVTTAGVGTYTLDYEYFNGSTWEDITETDGTSILKSTGIDRLSFNAPVDWATTTINSQGPFFFIRGVVDGGTVTTTPLGQQAWTGLATSAYTSGSNLLTVTELLDDMGDRTLTLTATPPSSVGGIAELVSTIVDQGIAGAVLTVILGEPTAIPGVLRKI